MQDDISDATRRAIDQRIAAANRICIVALMGTVREPQLYRCAAEDYSGVYDLELFVREQNMADYRRGGRALR